MNKQRVVKFFFIIFFLWYVSTPVFVFAQSQEELLLFEGELFAGHRVLTVKDIRPVSISAIDLGKDGLKELIIGASPGTDPRVMLLRYDGSMLNSFYAYPKAMRGGVSVAVGDLDGDEKQEIITIPASDGHPQVKVFNSFGKELRSFYAFDKQQVGEYAIAVANVSGDKKPEIIVFTGRGLMPRIAVFDSQGKRIDMKINSSGLNVSGLVVSPIDLGSDGVSEIVVANRVHEKGTIRIIRGDGTEVSSFSAFESNESGVVSIGAFDVVGDAKEEILVLISKQNEHLLKIFDGFGVVQSSFPLTGITSDMAQSFLYTSLKGVVFPELIVYDSLVPQPILGKEGKVIEVSLADQRLRYYDDGFQIASLMVSTGKPSTPTPIGEFKVENKYRRPYSRLAKLYMPYWMAFKIPSWGFHELPEWPNGAKEGADHLGKRVSGGCVRLPVGAAEALWNWADVGTKVKITKE